MMFCNNVTQCKTWFDILNLLESGDSGHIHYDDKAIETLLDRTRGGEEESTEEDSSVNLMANEYLASFKVRFVGNI